MDLLRGVAKSIGATLDRSPLQAQICRPLS